MSWSHNSQAKQGMTWKLYCKNKWLHTTFGKIQILYTYPNFPQFTPESHSPKQRFLKKISLVTKKLINKIYSLGWYSSEILLRYKVAAPFLAIYQAMISSCPSHCTLSTYFELPMHTSNWYSKLAIEELSTLTLHPKSEPPVLPFKELAMLRCYNFCRRYQISNLAQQPQLSIDHCEVQNRITKVSSYYWWRRSRARSRETGRWINLCQLAPALVSTSHIWGSSFEIWGSNCCRRFWRLTRGTIVGRPWAHCNAKRKQNWLDKAGDNIRNT